MKNRISENPGRVLITPENGSAPFYATMARADNPTQEGDPLDKNTLLKDDTAALFGKGADALPDQILSVLSKAALWKQLGHEPIYDVYKTVSLANCQEGDTIHLVEGTSLVEYTVAKKNYESELNGAGRTLLIQKSHASLSSSIWNSTNSGVYDGSNIDQQCIAYPASHFSKTLLDVILPTKIKVWNGSKNAIDILERIVFLPSATEYGLAPLGSTTWTPDGEKLPDASIVAGSSNYGNLTRTAVYYDGDWMAYAIDDDGSTTWTKVTQNYATSRLAFCVSNDFELTIYQDSGGNYYDEQAYTDSIHELTDVLGNGLSTTKIETGSYAGAGAAGADNPNKLTFQSPPKFVFVQDASLNPATKMLFLIRGVQKAWSDITQGSSSYALNVTWNGNEVSWYAKAVNYHDYQMNAATYTYNYIAIL